MCVPRNTRHSGRDYISLLFGVVSICKLRQVKKAYDRVRTSSRLACPGRLLFAKDRSQFVSDLSGAGEISRLEGNCSDPRVTAAAKFFR